MAWTSSQSESKTFLNMMHCRWRLILIVSINFCAVLELLAYLSQWMHLFSDSTAADLLGDIEYEDVVRKGRMDILYKSLWLLFGTLLVNLVVFKRLALLLWNRICSWSDCLGVQSALFHCLWSVTAVALYVYLDVALFSTWLFRINDSGLADLVINSRKDHVWTVVLLGVSGVSWFVTGYAGGMLRPKWQKYVIPLATLLYAIQIIYDLVVEPSNIMKSSLPIDPTSPIYDSIKEVINKSRISFPIERVRFRKGWVGSGQTFLPSTRIILLSGPSLSQLKPSEWSAMVATELATIHYNHSTLRLLSRFASRLVWCGIASIMLQPNTTLFDAFGIHSTLSHPLVFGFAITEIYAAQFDRVAVLIKMGLFRWMERRADGFAIKLIEKSIVKRMIINSAVLNQRPPSYSFLYQLIHCDKQSVSNRISHL